MVRDIRLHGANDAEVIGKRCCLSKELAGFEAALAVALPREGRAEGCPRLAFSRDVVARQFLSVVFIERGLPVKGVDVRRTTVGEDVDDVLDLRRQRGAARCQRVQWVDRSRGAVQVALQ